MHLFRRLLSLDLWLFAVAALFALPTLEYPFFSDHAAGFYVGRWWAEGLLPYRDAWHSEAPGVFAAHALGVLALGERMLAIRAFDLAAVLAMALGIGLSSRPEGKRIRGAVGTVAILVVAYFYSTNSFAETAQAETWAGAFVLLSFVMVRPSTMWPWTTLFAGLFGGISILFLPYTFVICCGVTAMLVLRFRNAMRDGIDRRANRNKLAIYVLGVALAVYVALLFFWAAGGLGGLLDWAIGFAPADRAAGRSAGDFIESARGFVERQGAWPFLLLPLAGLGLGHSLRNAKERKALAWMLLVLALASSIVVWQFSAKPQHWVIVEPFLLLLVAHGVQRLAEIRSWTLALVGVASLVLGSVAAPAWEQGPDEDYTYGRHIVATAKLRAGRLTRNQFLAGFERSDESFLEMKKFAAELLQEAQQEDKLLIVGYHPLLHTISGLQSMDRFSHDAWSLDNFSRREDWASERALHLEQDPPRFVVVEEAYEEDLELLEGKGYEELMSGAGLVVYALPKSEAALVVIDMQKDFCTGGPMAIDGCEELVPIISRAMDHFEILLAVRQWHPEGHVSFETAGPRGTLPEHAIEDSEGAEFIDGIDGERFARIFSRGEDPDVDNYSAFFDADRQTSTGLQEYLVTSGVAEIFIVGLGTEQAIKYTVLDAAQLGFEPNVIIDATRGFNREEGDMEQALGEIRAAGSWVLESPDFFADAEEEAAEEEEEDTGEDEDAGEEEDEDAEWDDDFDPAEEEFPGGEEDEDVPDA